MIRDRGHFIKMNGTRTPALMPVELAGDIANDEHLYSTRAFL